MSDTVKRAATSAAALTLSAGFLFVTPVRAHADSGYGTTVSATMTMTTKYARALAWSIDTSASPRSWALFEGDSATSTVTVSVARSLGPATASIAGQVCVTNGGAVATKGLAIRHVVSVEATKSAVTTAAVDTTSNPVLDAGETGCYPYQVTLDASQVVPGATYQGTADVSITNHSGSVGTPSGPNPRATAAMPATPTSKGPKTVTVTDTNGMSWTADGDQSWTYPRTFTCADAGTRRNTAKILQTGASDSASVSISCDRLVVSKTAKATFTRDWNWTIEKTVDDSSVTLQRGQSTQAGYTVTVRGTATDGEYRVAGAVKVRNPATTPATITSVADVFRGAPIALTCPVTFPHDLPAGGTLTCSYAADLDAATDGVNDASATQQHFVYAPDGSRVAGSTSAVHGTAQVHFADPTKAKDRCILVSDPMAPDGTFSQVCGHADGTTTEQIVRYAAPIGPFDDCADHVVSNIASYGDDSHYGDTGSASADVVVHGACTPEPTPTPGVEIVKGDARGNAADSEDTRVILPDGSADLVLTVTNRGTEPLREVVVSDTVVTGGVVSGLTCDFSALGGPASGLTWDGPLLVGASFTCLATLAGVPVGAAHLDVGSVRAVGELSGRTVTDDNPYHAVRQQVSPPTDTPKPTPPIDPIPPAPQQPGQAVVPPATAPSRSSSPVHAAVHSPVLATTGGQPGAWVLLAGGLVAVGGLLMRVARRRAGALRAG